MAKPPLIATLMTAAGIIVLCTLGAWQFQRMQWKNEILTNLNAAYNEGASSKQLTPQSLDTQQFAYGVITGTFQPDKAILIGPRVHGALDKKIGSHVIVPVIKDNHTYLVNLGWTDSDLKSLAIHTKQNQTITFDGLARKPDWNSFTPDNNLEKDLWYKTDITEIAAAKELENPVPYTIYASTPGEFTSIQPHERWQPSNNHAQYMAFWFAMALSLIGIFWLRFIAPPAKSS